MKRNTAEIAKAYYTAMAHKDMATLEQYLHPDVKIKTPLFALQGKEAVSESVKNFSSFFITLVIRAACGSEDHALVAYTVTFPAPFGTVPSTALLTFKDGLIADIELLYDPRPFIPKVDEIIGKR